MISKFTATEHLIMLKSISGHLPEYETKGTPFSFGKPLKGRVEVSSLVETFSCWRQQACLVNTAQLA